MTMKLTNVLVGGIDAIAEVDGTKFTPNVVEYLLRIGLKNVLQDSHASITEKTDADETERKAKKTAQAMKKLDSLYAGDVSAVRVNSADPVEREMRSMADEKLVAKVRAAGKKKADFDKAVWAKFVEQYMKQFDAQLRAAATAKLAVKVDTADEEFKLEI